MTVLADWKKEAIEVLTNIGIDVSDVMEDGFIHPRDNGGVVTFQQIRRDIQGNKFVVNDDIAYVTRRINVKTKEEVS